MSETAGDDEEVENVVVGEPVVDGFFAVEIMEYASD